MLLVTGYEPFGDHETNPSGRVAERLDGREVAGREVAGAVLPVEFDAAADGMADLLATHDPEAVVGTGLAAGRAAVCVERVGINVDNCAGVPDNAGAEPRDRRIDPDDPDAYFATIPVRETVAALLDSGVPARVSNTAGTHLCNHLLYATRAHVEARGPDAPVGFVHLPCTPGQAARKGREEEALAGGEVPPSLPLEMQVEAVERVLREAVEGEAIGGE